MKTNKVRKFKTEVSLVSCVKILGLSLLIMAISFFLFDNIFNDALADIVYNFDAMIWYTVMEYKWQIVLLYYVLVVTISSFIVIKQANSYMDKLFSSIESIIENPDEKINLPNDLELLETELNRIRMYLVQSNAKAKEEENKKNDLILYMAHDLRTPLTSVIGYLNILNEEKNVSESIRNKYIKIALDKALRVEDLTNQFFEITRYNLHEMSLNKSNIDLVMLLNQLIEECYPMLREKGLKINLKSPKKIIFNGDGDLLARAFSNLIKNATNYATNNTNIDIIISESDSSITLEFKNEGEKIPSYKLEKLFEKFYRGDDSRNSSSGGSGLGLPITKEIIELHDGIIEVSNKSKHIIFKIVLKK